jgi:hypothetical protein
VRDVESAVVRPMTEAAHAELRRGDGVRPVVHAGHHWADPVRGFYTPVHTVMRLDADEATAPRRPHWGFRAALSDRAAASANGTLPVHLLQDVGSYDTSRLSGNRRKHLRQCYRRTRLVVLDDADLLRRQGHAVVESAGARTGYGTAPSRDAYLAGLDAYTSSPDRLVLAGLVGDDLGGYVSGYAVEGTAYLEHLFVATEALTTNVTLGLIHEFVLACRRSGAVDEVVNGLHAREDPALDTFKEGIGFPVVHLPSRVHVNRLAHAVLRRRYPDKLYRLEGLPGWGTGGGDPPDGRRDDG